MISKKELAPGFTASLTWVYESEYFPLTKCYFSISVLYLGDNMFSYLGDGAVSMECRKNDYEITEYMIKMLDKSDDIRIEHIADPQDAVQKRLGEIELCKAKIDDLKQLKFGHPAIGRLKRDLEWRIEVLSRRG